MNSSICTSCFAPKKLDKPRRRSHGTNDSKVEALQLAENGLDFMQEERSSHLNGCAREKEKELSAVLLEHPLKQELRLLSLGDLDFQHSLAEQTPLDIKS